MSYDWTRNPSETRWHRCFGCGDMGDREEAALEGTIYECGGLWRYTLELQTPTTDAIVAVGQAPNLQLACARAALAADDLLAAMRALSGVVA
jgi:hypothetical protein